jgi:NAD(P)-dependent dehydrogenase (short-subunit alcohol dehydrogenase family)
MKPDKKSAVHSQFIPALRMLLSNKKLKTIRLFDGPEQIKISNDPDGLQQILNSYRKETNNNWDGNYLVLDKKQTPGQLIKTFGKKHKEFRKEFKIDPAIILIRDIGIIASGESPAELSKITTDLSKVLGKKGFSSGSFKRKVYSSDKQSIMTGRICIVTGGAQGFGEGLAENLARAGASIVIADLNEEKGKLTLKKISEHCYHNEAIFVKTDVSNPISVQNLIDETVRYFGGIDLLISNAGILKAGGLDEMDPETFELMTKINYQGFFLCAKYSSPVMKLQAEYKPGYYSDIIQINSKSGLKGSKNNFTYSGGKFGGIGLTQSFALELAPWRIKVNAICPGNFFEGPLWTDNKTGLFVQYLKAGKVPGAKTIDDVKRYYEKQVPLGRGCRIEDVYKALEYIVSQEYETGQAVPVTGGQIMLS